MDGDQVGAKIPQLGDQPVEGRLVCDLTAEESLVGFQVGQAESFKPFYPGRVQMTCEPDLRFGHQSSPARGAAFPNRTPACRLVVFCFAEELALFEPWF